MEAMLSTLAFALLIGAQFLAAIVLISRRKVIYEDSEKRGHKQNSGVDQAEAKVVEERLPATAA